MRKYYSAGDPGNIYNGGYNPQEEKNGAENPPSNNIFAIAPYKWNGLYVFDVLEWGTIREILVTNATEYLKTLTNDAEKFLLVFSQNKFSGWTNKIELVEFDEDGHTYRGENNEPIWLCNFLDNYFEEAPQTIYLQVIV